MRQTLPTSDDLSVDSGEGPTTVLGKAPFRRYSLHGPLRGGSGSWRLMLRCTAGAQRRTSEFGQLRPFAHAAARPLESRLDR